MKSKQFRRTQAEERAALRADGDPTYLSQLAEREARFPGRK